MSDRSDRSGFSYFDEQTSAVSTEAKTWFASLDWYKKIGIVGGLGIGAGLVGLAILTNLTKPSGNLSTEQFSAVNTAAGKVVASQTLTTADGKVFNASLASCSGTDSDKDGNVTCTGTRPHLMQGGAVGMQSFTMTCNVPKSGTPSGCKLTTR